MENGGYPGANARAAAEAARSQLNLVVFAAILAGSFVLALFAGTIPKIVFGHAPDQAILFTIFNYAIGYVIGAGALISRNLRQSFRNDEATKSSVHHPWAIAIAISTNFLAMVWWRGGWLPVLIVAVMIGLLGYGASVFGMIFFQRRQSVQSPAETLPNMLARSIASEPFTKPPEHTKTNPEPRDYDNHIIERAHNEHILPPEIQRMLPVGTRVLSYDGEVVFRTMVQAADINVVDYRMYSLTPFMVNPQMYARRWDGKSVQETYLAIEAFHGHLATMYFLYVPNKNTAATGQYRAESVAVVSHSNNNWLWVTTPKAVEFIFEGNLKGRVIGELWRVMRPGGYAKRLDKNNQNAAVLDQVVMYLRFEFERNKASEREARSGERI